MCPKCRHASHRLHLIQHFYGTPTPPPASSSSSSSVDALSRSPIPFPANHPLYDPAQDDAALRSRRALELALFAEFGVAIEEGEEDLDAVVTCPVAGCECVCIR